MKPSHTLLLRMTSSKSENMCHKKVVIVGAGISGLSCAKSLLDRGIKEEDLALIEWDKNVGGRVKTDFIDGFLLDRGFQVFIENYPYSKSIFDYNSLNLQPFLPGAFVKIDENFYSVSDPFRRPQDILKSLTTPIGTLLDKLKVGLFSVIIRFLSIEYILQSNETDTYKYLSEKLNLSSSMIDKFFKPFFQGIFLSPLQFQSSKMFQFVFKMFTEGQASLPKDGMESIPRQLASQIPSNSIILNTKVEKFSYLENNGDKKFHVQTLSTSKIKNTYTTDRLIIATDPINAKKLIESSGITTTFNIPDARGSTTLYFGMDTEFPPILDRILILNGESDASNDDIFTINNLCFPSQISKSYAPYGKSLLSVTLCRYIDDNISDQELEKNIRMQLRKWWSKDKDIIDSWYLLKIYRIKYAQPAQNPPYNLSKPSAIAENIFCCGDHMNSATLNGAIESGILVANEVIESL